MLERVIPRVQAWELLHDPHYLAGIGCEEFYDLMTRAGYSEETAQRAANERGWVRLDKGVSL